MARSRNIKPAFFKNYELADQGSIAQVLFAGLWCMADREGRLEDKPRLIKAELFPYYECDVNGYLTQLARLGFVSRYMEDGVAVIQVLNFKKHQSPHSTEKTSTLPEFNPETSRKYLSALDNGEPTVNPPKHNDGNRPDSLIPDSLIPSSLIPSSLIPEVPAAEVSAPAQKSKPAQQHPSAAAYVWEAYSTAYFNRYGTEPVRNAKVNSQLSQLVKRVGESEAPSVASFYVGHQSSYYVSRMHPVDCLLSDAEKLRTEWATGRRMTNTKAQQTDKTATNLGAFQALIEAAEAEDRANGKR